MVPFGKAIDCSFVEVSLIDEPHVTKVIENSLNPKWENESWSWDIEEESNLQDVPLIFKVCFDGIAKQ